MIYNPLIHCALLRNRLGRITPCWGLRVLESYCVRGMHKVILWCISMRILQRLCMDFEPSSF